MSWFLIMIMQTKELPVMSVMTSNWRVLLQWQPELLHNPYRVFLSRWHPKTKVERSLVASSNQCWKGRLFNYLNYMHLELSRKILQPLNKTCMTSVDQLPQIKPKNLKYHIELLPTLSLHLYRRWLHKFNCRSNNQKRSTWNVSLETKKTIIPPRFLTERDKNNSKFN